MKLSSSLPPDRTRELLRNTGIASIPNFMHEQAASELAHCLLNDVPWGLAFRLNGNPVTRQKTSDVECLPEKDKQLLIEQINARFQFVYNTYMMVTAYIEKRDPGLLLHRALEWLNSKPVLNYFKALTGTSAITKVNAQATRYLPGHFLKNHNDHNAEEGRRYAYVLSLTRDWQADWGGLLHFTDKQGRVKKTIVPAWNTLNVFAVPQDHFVSYVAPFATKPRLAITGWMLDK